MTEPLIQLRNQGLFSDVEGTKELNAYLEHMMNMFYAPDRNSVKFYFEEVMSLETDVVDIIVDFTCVDYSQVENDLFILTERVCRYHCAPVLLLYKIHFDKNEFFLRWMTHQIPDNSTQWLELLTIIIGEMRGSDQITVEESSLLLSEVFNKVFSFCTCVTHIPFL